MENDVGLGIGIIIALIAFYFLPLMVAMMRGHRQTGAIAIMTIFLGWTFLGWVAALVWSFTNPGDARATSKQPAQR